MVEFIFFSSAYEPVSKSDHSLSHNKIETIEIIHCLFSDFIEINNKITGNSQNMWRVSSTLLNNTWVKEEISGDFLKYFN